MTLSIPALVLVVVGGVAAGGGVPCDSPRGLEDEARLALAAGQWSAARSAAEELVRAVPDDLAGHALVADACLAAREDACAERAIQWMLDLRPADPRGLVRAAQFRVATGDPQGALALVADLVTRIDASRTDARDLLSRMARVAADAGAVELATALDEMTGNSLRPAREERIP